MSSLLYKFIYYLKKKNICNYIILFLICLNSIKIDIINKNQPIALISNTCERLLINVLQLI